MTCSNHHHHTKSQSIFLLLVSFFINLFLSFVEFVGGVISGSVSLIGDALHNTCDAFSILVAVIALKIGCKKANAQYTYGFRRAEVVGGFVNLILLFLSGLYLCVEGIERLIFPQPIDGYLIMGISVVALIVDIMTAKISHHDAHHNHNMKMVFVHNLADAFGSVGVILSGACVVLFNVYRVDGMIAIMIACYMIFQSVVSFSPIVNILMNAVPDGMNVDEIKQAILSVKGVQDVHHIHVWMVNENDVSLECHVVSKDRKVLKNIKQMLDDIYHIKHCNIQVEPNKCCSPCDL